MIHLLCLERSSLRMLGARQNIMARKPHNLHHDTPNTNYAFCIVSILQDNQGCWDDNDWLVVPLVL